MLNKYWFNLLASTVILYWVTLYNGFPVIYNDTATYLKSGFELSTPMDRPITYGLFILLSSCFKLSIFLIPLFQNLLLSWLLLECFVRCLGQAKLNYYLLTLVPLAAFTGLCWVSNQIFADLFTSFIFLSAFLVLTFKEGSKKNLALFYFVFLWSVGSHLSHITITQLFLLGSLPVAGWLLPKDDGIEKSVVWKRGAALVVLGLSCILIMGSAISKSKPIFFTGKLCENGILKKYLDENCGTSAYMLCAIKDELTYSAVFFVWEKEGATEKLGGWKAVKDEYKKIDNAILKDPKYLKMLAVESVKSSLRQFTMNNIGEGNHHLQKDSNNAVTVVKYFPREAGLFLGATQNNAGINTDFFNPFYSICYLLFAVLFVVLFVRKTVLKQFDSIYLLSIMIVFGICFNNIMNASLANAINRFGVRVIWLMAFAALLMLVEVLVLGREKKV